MNNEYFKNIAEAWQQITEKKTLDPVDQKALKGKHADRKDKDIDNDGDVDKSDEYLHKRRQAVSKAMKESEDEGEGKGDDKMKPCPKCDGSMDNHDPDCPMADDDDDEMEKDESCGSKKHMKKESVGSNPDYVRIRPGSPEAMRDWIKRSDEHSKDKNWASKPNRYSSKDYFSGSFKLTDKEASIINAWLTSNKVPEIKKKEAIWKINSKYVTDEAKRKMIASMNKSKGGMKEAVTHQNWGYGEVIETTDDGVNVYFEHGIEFNVPFEDLTVIGEAKKMKGDDPCWKDYEMVGTKKKNGKEVPNCVPKESVKEGTVTDFEEEVKSSYVSRSQSMRDAIRQVWEGAVQAKQGVAGKYQEKQKGDPKRHNSGDKMPNDHDYDNPEMTQDDAQGHEDATKAGRVTKQAPTRGGEKRIGDKSIINPVKGAVTKTTGKE